MIQQQISLTNRLTHQSTTLTNEWRSDQSYLSELQQHLYNIRFGKSTHFSMISNSVTPLWSYTNTAIATPISLETPASSDIAGPSGESLCLRIEHRYCRIDNICNCFMMAGCNCFMMLHYVLIVFHDVLLVVHDVLLVVHNVSRCITMFHDVLLCLTMVYDV